MSGRRSLVAAAPIALVVAIAVGGFVRYVASDDPNDPPRPSIDIEADERAFGSVFEMAAATDRVVHAVVVDVGPGRTVTDPVRQDVGIVTSLARLDLIADRDRDNDAGRTDIIIEQAATLFDGTPVTVNGVAALAIGDEGVAFLVEGGSESQPYHALVGSQGWIPAVDGRLTPPAQSVADAWASRSPADLLAALTP